MTTELRALRERLDRELPGILAKAGRSLRESAERRWIAAGRPSIFDLLQELDRRGIRAPHERGYRRRG